MQSCSICAIALLHQVALLHSSACVLCELGP
jgi:hypothetical protein